MHSKYKEKQNDLLRTQNIETRKQEEKLPNNNQ